MNVWEKLVVLVLWFCTINSFLATTPEDGWSWVLGMLFCMAVYVMIMPTASPHDDN